MSDLWGDPWDYEVTYDNHIQWQEQHALTPWLRMMGWHGSYIIRGARGYFIRNLERYLEETDLKYQLKRNSIKDGFYNRYTLHFKTSDDVMLFKLGWDSWDGTAEYDDGSRAT